MDGKIPGRRKTLRRGAGKNALVRVKRPQNQRAAYQTIQYQKSERHTENTQRPEIRTENFFDFLAETHAAHYSALSPAEESCLTRFKGWHIITHHPQKQYAFPNFFCMSGAVRSAANQRLRSVRDQSSNPGAGHRGRPHPSSLH